MKVTKKGINPTTWRGIYTCPRCNAQLEISYRDIYVRMNRTFYEKLLKELLDKSTFYYYVNCCECRQVIEITEALPAVIKNKVKDEESRRLMHIFFGL